MRTWRVLQLSARLRPRGGGWVARLLVFAGLAALLGAASGCGSGDDCSGFISVNGTPADCARLAMQFGCQSFQIEGPSCGLLGCATCGGLPTSTPTPTPTPTAGAG